MKTLKQIGQCLMVGAAAAFLGACIPSVYPFYNEKDLQFDSALLGEWRENANSSDADAWKFEADGAKAYKLTITQKGKKTGTFSAHLFNMKEHQYLDLVPTDCKFAEEQADIVNASVFLGHLLACVSRSDRSMSVAFFDFDWLEKQLKENPRLIAHAHGEKQLLLTAGTRDLQRFVLKNQARLFDKATELLKQ
jgi:hypothetical protein